MRLEAQTQQRSEVFNSIYVSRSPMTAYQLLATGQPDYLASELHVYQPQRCLRSSSQELLTVPHCNKMPRYRREYRAMRL